jgi:hypothetical protein
MTPQSPTNVCIHRGDGTEVPCELRYVGVEDGKDGQSVDMWEICGAVFLPGQDTLTIDVLPARTGLRFAADAAMATELRQCGGQILAEGLNDDLRVEIKNPPVKKRWWRR